MFFYRRPRCSLRRMLGGTLGTHRVQPLLIVSRSWVTPHRSASLQLRLKWLQPGHRTTWTIQIARLDASHGMYTTLGAHNAVTRPFAVCTLVRDRQEPVKDTRNGTGLRGAFVRRSAYEENHGARGTAKSPSFSALRGTRLSIRLANGEISCNSIQTTLCLPCAKQFFPSFALFGEVLYLCFATGLLSYRCGSSTVTS
ncbi:hypothetical protein MVEN_00775000 [Mycena venus]|uniref:Uncharacterized protein n=1 Tax=Mycena venus TaxID=2733690 RepID=A0A8H7D5V3_9AGAR|nr:hypothetical protein MVEN_00775000 [Mycena venus]